MASQTITALGNAIINLIKRRTPIATANTVGMVKPDGSTINIDANGVISAGSGSGQSNNILDFKWSDHLLNDMSWLRADTFSWQDGNTYSQAYNELLSEYNNSASTAKTEGSITFKRTPKGYKIALATQETAIAEKYATNGIAWYYVLDTANKQFKLPRTKWGFKGLRDNVGNTIAESLPNITGELRYATDANGNYISNSLFKLSHSTYPLVQTMYGSSNNQRTPYFDASLSSSTYQNGAPVQERATQMYLYFYVGGFTKSAEAQTAGLNAELLNGKADITTPSIQAPYIKDTYVNGKSGYIKYSNGFKYQWGYNYQSAGAATGETTISFLIPFSNTDYYFSGAALTGEVGNNYIQAVSCEYPDYRARTTSTVKIVGRISRLWVAWGY